MKKFVAVLLFAVAVAVVVSCGDKSDSTSIPVDDTLQVASSYCLGEFWQLEMDDSSGSEIYSFLLKDLSASPVAMSGSRDGTTLTLAGAGSGFTLAIDGTFSVDGATLSAAITATLGADTFVLNVYGDSGACATTDVTTAPPAKFVDDHFTDLSIIERISLFRSAARHDSSDDFESCRSMKHYYSPPLAERINDNVEVFSPVPGTVVHLNREDQAVDDGVTNQQLILTPDTYPAYRIALFHIDLVPGLVAGDRVVASQLLGHANMVRNGVGPHMILTSRSPQTLMEARDASHTST